MSDTIPLQNAMGLTIPNVDFKKIPLEQLQLPTELFDHQIVCNSDEPEMLIPLTVYQSDGFFIVIDGCKRLCHARKTGIKTCHCGVVTPTPDTFHAALLRITLNRGRVLSFFEKLLYVKWVKGHCNKKHYQQACLLLSISDRERFEFERLSACDRSIITAVEAGTLEKNIAIEVDQLTTADRTALISFFSRYTFSRQMQRELLDWLPELSFREKSSIADLIASPWITKIEQEEKLNVPQKINRLRQAFFNRRFPTLASAKKRWSEQAAQLNPEPSRVTFKPSEAFEKNRLEMKITVTSADQAQKIFSRLCTISSEKWEQLIYPAQFSVEPE